MGAGYGGYVALSPAVMIAHLFGPPSDGQPFSARFIPAVGLCALVGPPLVGMIIDRTGSYRIAIGAAFTIAMLAFAC